jgi:hypothetical protein
MFPMSSFGQTFYSWVTVLLRRSLPFHLRKLSEGNLNKGRDCSFHKRRQSNDNQGRINNNQIILSHNLKCLWKDPRRNGIGGARFTRTCHPSFLSLDEEEGNARLTCHHILECLAHNPRASRVKSSGCGKR